jgi:hypothetical protein
MRHEELSLGVVRMDSLPVTASGTTNISRSSMLRLSCTVAQVLTAVFAEQTFTVPGVDPTDRFLVCGSTYAVAGAPCISARCATAGSLILGFLNASVGNITPGASVIDLIMIRQGKVT